MLELHQGQRQQHFLLTCKNQPKGCFFPHYAQSPRATLSHVCAALLDKKQEIKGSIGLLHAPGMGSILGNSV